MNIYIMQKRNSTLLQYNIYRLWQAMHASFRGQTLQCKPWVFCLRRESMVLSSVPPFHSMVTFPFFSLSRKNQPVNGILLERWSCGGVLGAGFYLFVAQRNWSQRRTSTWQTNWASSMRTQWWATLYIERINVAHVCASHYDAVRTFFE